LNWHVGQTPIARFIEKKDAQLRKNNRNIVPSTLTALRSVLTDFICDDVTTQLSRLDMESARWASKQAASRKDSRCLRTSDRIWKAIDESIVVLVESVSSSTQLTDDAVGTSMSVVEE
jgi:hypothetical protein